MTISELYQTYPNVLILHGITRIGAENDVPTEKTFADRVENAIQESNASKMSTHTFAIGLNDRHHLWGTAGIILRESDILAADIEDTGITKDTLHLGGLFQNPDYQNILLGQDRTGHNELVVKHAIPISIYYLEYSEFTPTEIRLASESLGLPVFFLKTGGLFPTRWNDITKSFSFSEISPVDLAVLLRG